MKKIVIPAMIIFISLMPMQEVRCGMEESFGLSQLEDRLPESAEEILGDTGIMSMDTQGLAQRIWDYVRGKLDSILREVLRPVAAVMAAALLCSCTGELFPEGIDANYVNLSGCIAVAAISISDVNSMVALGRETMAELSDFSRALLPTLTTAACTMGAVSSAPAKYASAVLFLDILISAANKVIFPLICGYIAMSLASSAFPGARLGGVVKLFKWACRMVLTGLVSVFTLYLGVTGIISGSGDAAATKAAKTVISAALPVVGGIISDAAGTIVAGAGVIKGAVGVFGMLAVLAVCILPFLRMGLRYALFKAAAAISSGMAGEALGKLIEAIGSANGMLLSLIGVEAIFIYISVISLVKAVGL